MRKIRHRIVLGVLFAGLQGIIGAPSAIASETNLPSPSQEPLRLLDQPLGAPFPRDNQLSSCSGIAYSRLLNAVSHSLRYLSTPAAQAAYSSYPIPDITRTRVLQSVHRLRALLLQCNTLAELYRSIQEEFVLYESIGQDGAGTVHFTGYFEPTFAASRIPTPEYRYPLYGRPADLETWSQPHPSRVVLEGSDGLQGYQGPLRGLELVWMRDRLEAFLVQVQGSARLQLPDGTPLSVGYAGRTDYDYTSIGRELVNDGKLAADDLTLDRLIAHFRDFPADLDLYLPRNNRFIFFEETDGGPPQGTLSVPVIAGRSIATDHRLMPPGAIAFIMFNWPTAADDRPGASSVSGRYVLNQDTGGAIQGAGRVDVFMGSGVAAGELAGQINTNGRLLYLLLRP